MKKKLVASLVLMGVLMGSSISPTISGLEYNVVEAATWEYRDEIPPYFPYRILIKYDGSVEYWASNDPGVEAAFAKAAEDYKAAGNWDYEKHQPKVIPEPIHRYKPNEEKPEKPENSNRPDKVTEKLEEKAKKREELKKKREELKKKYTREELESLEDVFEEIKEENGDIDAIPVDSIVSRRGIKFDTPPVVKSGRTLIPVRAISEGFKATVGWNNDTREVTIEKDGTVIVIAIGSDEAIVNGEVVSLDTSGTPAQVMSRRTYVPLRFIAEKLGLKVNWDKETSTIELEEELEDYKEDLEDELEDLKEDLEELLAEQAEEEGETDDEADDEDLDEADDDDDSDDDESIEAIKQKIAELEAELEKVNLEISNSSDGDDTSDELDGDSDDVDTDDEIDSDEETDDEENSDEVSDDDSSSSDDDATDSTI